MPSYQTFLQFSKTELWAAPSEALCSLAAVYALLSSHPHSFLECMVPEHPHSVPSRRLPGVWSPNVVPTRKIRKFTKTRLLGGGSVPIATPRRTSAALPAGCRGASVTSRRRFPVAESS